MSTPLGQVVASRLLFIDSAENITADGSRFKVSVPSQSFTAKSNQMMKLSLQAFEIRRNWYAVNQSNNVFFILLESRPPSFTRPRFAPVIIPRGNYSQFGDVSELIQNSTAVYQAGSTVTPPGNYDFRRNSFISAVKYAVDKSLHSIKNNLPFTDEYGNVISPALGAPFQAIFTGATPVSTVIYNSITRLMDIQFPANTNTGTLSLLFPQFMQALDWFNYYSTLFPTTLPTIQNELGAFAFGDTAELFGARIWRDDNSKLPGDPNDELNNVANLATYLKNFSGMQRFVSGQTVTFQSYYPCSLNTLENMYLRIQSITTNNFQSTQNDPDLPNTKQIVPTDIFARIPIPASTFNLNQGGDIISYSTRTDEFSIMIDGRQLSTLLLALTDDKGRPIPQVARDQYKNESLSAKFVLKWELIQYNTESNYSPPITEINQSLVPPPRMQPEIKSRSEKSDPAISKQVEKSAMFQASRYGQMF